MVSLAYKKIKNNKTCGKLVTNIRKRRGARTEPCETPSTTLAKEDNDSSIHIQKVMLLMRTLSNIKVFLLYKLVPI